MSTYESLGPTSEDSDAGSDDYILYGQMRENVSESRVTAVFRLLCSR